VSCAAGRFSLPARRAISATARRAAHPVTVPIADAIRSFKKSAAVTADMRPAETAHMRNTVINVSYVI
jgi:hypothetical protein